ncbi:HEPN domain-containing protein [Thiococcus pfennigii]|uniref:HEPN domain-containing protein n=1 Tax=Thiococcus pfennigii TaxID=1057 RepID=UPI003B8381D2
MVAFHVQQGAEKALKAAFAHAGEPHWRTHGLATSCHLRSRETGACYHDSY